MQIDLKEREMQIDLRKFSFTHGIMLYVYQLPPPTYINWIK